MILTRFRMKTYQSEKLIRAFLNSKLIPLIHANPHEFRNHSRGHLHLAQVQVLAEISEQTPSHLDFKNALVAD
jgi:hypothetical protein